jgi:hypothetical protein
MAAARRLVGAADPHGAEAHDAVEAALAAFMSTSPPLDAQSQDGLDSWRAKRRDALDLWPENWLPVQIFADLLTQWNVTMGAVIGLRYEAMPFLFQVHRVSAELQAETFGALRVLENEAVKQLNTR